MQPVSHSSRIEEEIVLFWGAALERLKTQLDASLANAPHLVAGYQADQSIGCDEHESRPGCRPDP